MVENKSNVIIMKDGRSIDFGQRGKLKKKINISGEGLNRKVHITIDCINGDSHSMEFDSNDPLLFEYAAHGVSQKLTDSITKATDFEEVSFGVSKTIAQLKEGKWTIRNSDAMVRGFSDLLEAVRRIKKFEIDSPETMALKLTLTNKSESEIKQLKSNAAVKAVLAQIASEKAASKAVRLATEGVEDGLEDLL